MVNTFEQELNEQQYQAVIHTDGPLMVIAGAGSGKTRVLTYRVAHLLDTIDDLNTQEILVLTFTNKAANEMKNRIISLLDRDISYAWIGTFHSLFARILRYESEHLGFNNQFSIYDSSDSERLIRSIMEEGSIDPKRVNPRSIKKIISRYKNEFKTPDNLSEKDIPIGEIGRVIMFIYPLYQARLREHNAMDFDDLIIRLVQLFQENKKIAQHYQDRFKFILVDEYQDTNYAQYLALKCLGNKHRNICVVGDDAQSIYRFRGADVDNMNRFYKDFTPKIIPLEQNYRSTGYILKGAQSVIKCNRTKFKKKLWTKNDSGNKIKLFSFYNDIGEAEGVVQIIQEYRMRYGLSLSDIAIMYRTNSQSRMFESTLRQSNLAYQIVGGMSFYRYREVKDVICYISMLTNPSNWISLERIINIPPRGIGKKTMESLVNESEKNNISVWQLLEQAMIGKDSTIKLKPPLIPFVQAIKKAQQRLLDAKESWYDIILDMLEQSGYMGQFKQDNINSAGQKDRVIELLNSVSHFQQEHDDVQLGDFLSTISLENSEDSFDEEQDKVTLITVHSAKGLEFKMVFVVGLEERLFPLSDEHDHHDELEEERRLMYVAMTRAKEFLMLSHARNRMRYGRIFPASPSRFLSEIDDESLYTPPSFSKTPRRLDRNTIYNQTYQHKSKYIKTNTNSNTNYNENNHLFTIGTYVIHPMFGEGKISHRMEYGSNTKVIVNFDGRGEKTLLLRLAKLQIKP